MDSSKANDKCVAVFCVCSFGFALGLLWGIAMLILGFTSLYLGYGTPIVDFFGSIYLGYKGTILGAVIGGVWGFVDAFIAGVIFAWLYNCCVKCCAKCCMMCHKKEVKES